MEKPEKIYKCKVCSKEFDNKANLLRHEQCHKKYGTTGYCLICGKMLDTAKQKFCSLKCVGVYNSNTRHKMWKCDYCDAVLPNRKLWYNHKREVHNLSNSELQKIKMSRKSKEELSRIAKKGIETKRKNGTLHHTESTKIKLSLWSTTNNHRSNNFKHVPYIDYLLKSGKSIKLRGSYEIRFATYLDEHNIDWVYEKVIPYSDIENNKRLRYVKPDFYIPSLDIYFDTKGYLSEESKRKYKLVFEQTGIKINLIYKKDLESLESGIKKLSDWDKN